MPCSEQAYFSDYFQQKRSRCRHTCLQSVSIKSVIYHRWRLCLLHSICDYCECVRLWYTRAIMLRSI